MGYTTVSVSVISSGMDQTPDNVRKVLDFAGWNVAEVASELHIREIAIEAACKGTKKLPDSVWISLLDKAGRRSFDHDGDAA